MVLLYANGKFFVLEEGEQKGNAAVIVLGENKITMVPTEEEPKIELITHDLFAAFGERPEDYKRSVDKTIVYYNEKDVAWGVKLLHTLEWND